jgi:hypothetical protein
VNKFTPLQIAAAISTTDHPWYLCKWFESVNETEQPGLYLASNCNLTLFEAAELTYLDDARLASAPYGMFYRNLHPSGLVVEVSKFPPYLKRQDCGTNAKSLLAKVSELLGF